MKKAIYITLQSLYPDNDGGKKISLGRLLQLQNKYDNVTCVLYNYACVGTENFNAFLRENHIKLEEYRPERAKSFFSRLLHYSISIVKMCPEASYVIEQDSSFLQLLRREHLSDSDVDVYLDSIFLLPLIKTVNANYNMLFHNVESSFYRELSTCSTSITKKFFYLFESVKIKTKEREFFNMFVANQNLKSTFLTQNDKDYYKNAHCLLNDDRIFLNDNIIRCSGNVVHCASLDSKFILFPGSLNFPPNRQGVELFLEHFDSELQKLGIELRVTGQIDKSIKDAFSRFKSVRFTGVVDFGQLLEFFSSCLTVISPIFSGGGIKIKNLETISYGVPLVATKFSCIGVNTNLASVYVSNDSIADFCLVLSKFIQCEYHLS